MSTFVNGDGSAAVLASASAPAAAPRKPYLSIRPKRGWAPINFAEVFQFRDLVWSLGIRDTKLRYRQTALGVTWVILQPLMAAGIFTVVFGKIGNLASATDGVPYFFISYAGLLGWNIFSNTLGKTGGSLLANAALVSKVYFPRLVLPLSTILSTMVDFAVAFAMLLVIMPFFHVHYSPALLLLPLWITLLMLLSLGVGLYSAALSVTYRDVNYVVPVLTQMLMYASPVGYDMAAVQIRQPHLYTWIMFNPLSPILEGMRWSLLGTGQVRWDWVAYSAAISLAVFVAGSFAFRRMERKFADVI